MDFTKMRKTTLAALLCAATGVSALGACSPTNNIVSNAAKAAFEDRLAEQQVVDAKIKANIYERLIAIDKKLAVDVDVDVWKTEVMITGTLSSAELRNQVARSVQEDARITQFYNDVKLITADEQAQRREWKEKAAAGVDKASEVFDDFWINTKISTQLIGTEGVKSVNYRWRSVLGTVYLLGEAKSARELNTVVTIIKNIKGVNALKSHVPVRG